MFVTLLIVTFVVASAVSALVARAFSASMRRILDRVVAPDISGAWHRYLILALFVVGVSGGVRIWALERYLTPRIAGATALELNADRWTLEIYQTILGTLHSLAWLLLVAFSVLLLAYVLTRRMESRRKPDSP